MTGGILALDPGSEITGWAYADPGGQPESSRAILKFEGETVRDHGGRIGKRFGLFLKARIDVFQPKYIVREAPYIGGGRKPMNPEVILALAGIAWQIDTIAEQRGIICAKEVRAAYVRTFTRKGNATKAQVIAVCRQMGWSPQDDNEADALALLYHSELVLFPEMRATMVRPAGPLFSGSIMKRPRPIA